MILPLHNSRNKNKLGGSTEDPVSRKKKGQWGSSNRCSSADQESEPLRGSVDGFFEECALDFAR